MHQSGVRLIISAIIILSLFPSFCGPIFSQGCPVLVGDWALPATNSDSRHFSRNSSNANYRWIQFVALEKRIAFLGSYYVDGETLFSEIDIVDISLPTEPCPLGRIVVNGKIADIAVNDGIAFAAMKDSGLLVFDVTDPAQPQQIGFYGYEDSERVESILYDSGMLYLIGSNVLIIDVSDPEAPVLLGRLLGDELDLCMVAVRVGNYLFIGTYIGWINIIDVSDPSAPFLAAQTYTSREGYPVGLASTGDYLFVGADYLGLVVFDISDPIHPKEILIVWNSRVKHLAIGGHNLYTSDVGLSIYSIADPCHPHLLNSFPSAYSIDLDLEDDVLILSVSGMDIDLLIFDVDGCTHPRPVGKP